ncbi:discoidin domain-containing protein [Paenibacillus mucilaginosus]|uniref:mannan endo-1,4-beta-mannosidase n=2 Tax=Paenibacillus mucilaginosus TaxID=61624 RepID=F8FJV9_PAEMK|nr:Man1 [Paenibacillus mucilaginosus KNP414]WDM24998.1 discoidin domain-containing protein [Paenibacillus mucilaginosus]
MKMRRKWIPMMLVWLLIWGLLPSGIGGTAGAEGAVNIAPQAMLTVDSVTGTNPASNAVDGSLTTRWISGSTTYEHVFEMTWERAHPVDRVKVWSGNVGTGASSWHIRDFTLDYWNGSTWITLAAVTDNDKDNNAGEYNDLSFSPVTASRLRLHITKPSWGGYNAADDRIARLAEIEVYAAVQDGSDTTPPQEAGSPEAVAGSGQLTLRWSDPPDPDFHQVRITQEGSVTEAVYVSKGVEVRVLPGLTNGSTYTFRLQTADTAGNLSGGVRLTATPSEELPAPAPRLARFITRSGDRLLDGTEPFRFISMNGSNLTYIPSPVWHRADPWEQEDAFLSIRQMGGTVVRLYTLTIKGGTANGQSTSHINGLRSYDEGFFRDLDHVLKLANDYGIRVILPFIDTWEHVGGLKQFAAFRGKTTEQFYTDPELKEDYKHLVSYVLGRTNTYTGVKYKDDKAILAWETGNELYPTDEWTAEMAAYIKSIDGNHLVMDGRYGISSAALSDPNVDIVSNHYYESGGTNYALRAAADRNASMGRKAFIVGEFGHSHTANLTALADQVITSGTSGALLWTLKFHNKDGGFYNKPGDYRWPGFPSGASYDETSVMRMMQEKAHAIRGWPVPPPAVPRAPELLPVESVHGLYWRGSAGAQTYDIQRAGHPDGPWVTVGTDVSDSDIPFVPFKDTSAVEGSTYYYRVTAKNAAGSSVPSYPAGPVTAFSVPPVPTAPALLPIQSVSSIAWEPVKWADAYDLERAEAAEGPWSVAGSDLSEEDRPYQDATANSGIAYYYRLKAKNAGGISEPSNTVGPVTVHNAAQLAALTADSTTGTNVPAYAVDGSLSTRWLSGGGGEEHFLRMEWPAAQTINQVKLWSGASSGANWHIRSFTLAYWTGTEWKPLASVEDNEQDGFYGEYNELHFEPVRTTALQVSITKPSWQGLPVNPDDRIARIMELEAGYADRTAPGEVSGTAVISGKDRLTLTWTDPSDPDLAHIRIVPEGAAGAEPLETITKGVQTVTFGGLEKGSLYSYRLIAVDRTGNASPGVVVSGVPGKKTGEPGKD